MRGAIPGNEPRENKNQSEESIGSVSSAGTVEEELEGSLRWLRELLREEPPSALPRSAVANVQRLNVGGAPFWAIQALVPLLPEHLQLHPASGDGMAAELASHGVGVLESREAGEGVVVGEPRPGKLKEWLASDVLREMLSRFAFLMRKRDMDGSDIRKLKGIQVLEMQQPCQEGTNHSDLIWVTRNLDCLSDHFKSFGGVTYICQLSGRSLSRKALVGLSAVSSLAATVEAKESKKELSASAEVRAPSVSAEETQRPEELDEEMQPESYPYEMIQKLKTKFAVVKEIWNAAETGDQATNAFRSVLRLLHPIQGCSLEKQRSWCQGVVLKNVPLFPSLLPEVLLALRVLLEVERKAVQVFAIGLSSNVLHVFGGLPGGIPAGPKELRSFVELLVERVVNGMGSASRRGLTELKNLLRKAPDTLSSWIVESFQSLRDSLSDAGWANRYRSWRVLQMAHDSAPPSHTELVKTLFVSSSLGTVRARQEISGAIM